MRSVAKLAHSLCILAISLAAVGCPENKMDPEDAFRKFAKDLHERHAEAAWPALTAATRTELERRHRALIEARGQKTPKENEPLAAEILFEELGLVLLNPVESVAVVSPPGGSEVMLRVSVKDGRSADIKMVREGQTWKVDLMSSLQKAPPLDQDLKGKPERADTSTIP
jgi:hypothetical protein